MARRDLVSLKDEIRDLEDALAVVLVMGEGISTRQWSKDTEQLVIKGCASIQSLVVGRLRLLRAAIGQRATFDLLVTPHNEALPLVASDDPDVLLSDRPRKKSGAAGSREGKARSSRTSPRGR